MKKVLKKKRKELRENLKIGERVYVLAERIRKKAPQASSINSLYRTSVSLTRIQYILSEKKQIIGGIRYYWIKCPIADLPERFSRSELFALRSNFM